METMTAENKVLQFVSNFKQAEDNSIVRKQAQNALFGMDFPTTKVEDWKYTRVVKYAKRQYRQLEVTGNIDTFKIEGLEAHRLVFVNGFFNEGLSTILKDDAIEISKNNVLDEDYYTDLMEDTEENVFSLICKAYQTGGAFIKVLAGKTAKYPIHLVHIIKGEEIIANVRHFIKMEAGASATIIVSYHSNDADNSFTNIVLEGHLKENSNLKINRLQIEEKNVLHISKELFIQDVSSQFKSNVITTGSALTRNGLTVLVEGEKCHTELNGAYLGKEKQHIDNHTAIDQLAANCTSDELYKGVMDDHSTGVFNGKVIVRQDSQKIEAYQANRNILLSKDASVNSKPELEIYADDVKCTHGSTIGDLDEDALFYMRARGIAAPKAKQLLIAAFIADVLDRIEDAALRKAIDQLFFKDFGWEF